MKLPFDLRGSLAVWVGGLLLAIGVVFLAISAVQFSRDQRFVRDAVPGEATVMTKVIRTSIDRSAGSSSRTRTQHYDVVYRFAVDGITIEGRDETSRQRWEALTEGDRVGVLYIPANPSSNHLAGPRPWLVKTLLGVLGLVLAPLGGILVRRGLRQLARERYLMEHGIRTAGTVTELSVTNFKMNSEHYWRLKYEYADSQGRPHVGTFDLPEGAAREWKVGDVGNVRYDSVNPTEAVWLGR
jgi:hypothetical protein